MQNQPGPESPFVFRGGFKEILEQLGITLAFCVWPKGRIYLVNSLVSQPFALPLAHTIPGPLTCGEDHLAVAGRDSVTILEAAPSTSEGCPGCKRLVFPGKVLRTGRIHIEDMAWGRGRIWAADGRSNSLGLIGMEGGYRSQWRPAQERELTLYGFRISGLALMDGWPLYITALNRFTGELWHVPSRERVVSGLRLPLSPRMYQGEVFLLESAAAELVTADPIRGGVTRVARLPGLAHGLSIHDGYAFVGLSYPYEESEHPAGIAVVELATGQTLGTMLVNPPLGEVFDLVCIECLVEPGDAAELEILDETMDDPDQGEDPDEPEMPLENARGRMK